MPTRETSGSDAGGVLAGLLAPLRLPERVLQALDELRPLRLELTRVRAQTEPLADLLPAIRRLEDVLGARLAAVYEVAVALESEESHLNRTTSELGAKVGGLSKALAPVDDRLANLERAVHELAGEVGAIHHTLVGVKDDIQRTTGLRGERGVMERTRDVLTGGNKAEDSAGSQGSATAPD